MDTTKLDESLVTILDETEKKSLLIKRPRAEDDEGRALINATVAFMEACKELGSGLEKKLDQSREQLPAVKPVTRPAALTALLDDLVSRHPA